MKESFTGRTFERLTIIREIKPLVYTLKNGKKTKVRRYFCKCSCGRTTKSRHNDLKIGRSRSCGCLRAHEMSVYPIGRKEKGASYLRYMHGYYRRNAAVKAIPFQLSKKEFVKLVTAECYYCGAPPTDKPNQSTKRLKNVFHGTLATNGIDRVNPKRGYTASNSVPCCRTCNIAKHTMTKEEFFNWIERVHTRVHT